MEGSGQRGNGGKSRRTEKNRWDNMMVMMMILIKKKEDKAMCEVTGQCTNG